MRHTRYSVYAPPATLQDVADALNRPRNPEEGEPGLGPRTCRDDASTYPGLSDDGTPAPTERYFTLSVRPSDVDRFESILDNFSGVTYATWHPDKADGSPYADPLEHIHDHGLEVLPEETNV
ncbi:MAG: hypothetical protein ABEN55_13565 [Bradymonadaceae bacterium]